MMSPGKHPADNPTTVIAIGLALSVGDRPVARMLARELIVTRNNYDAKLEGGHPPRQSLKKPLGSS